MVLAALFYPYSFFFSFLLGVVQTILDLFPLGLIVSSSATSRGHISMS